MAGQAGSVDKREDRKHSQRFIERDIFLWLWTQKEPSDIFGNPLIIENSLVDIGGFENWCDQNEHILTTLPWRLVIQHNIDPKGKYNPETGDKVFVKELQAAILGRYLKNNYTFLSNLSSSDFERKYRQYYDEAINEAHFDEWFTKLSKLPASRL